MSLGAGSSLGGSRAVWLLCASATIGLLAFGGCPPASESTGTGTDGSATPEALPEQTDGPAGDTTDDPPDAGDGDESPPDGQIADTHTFGRRLSDQLMVAQAQLILQGDIVDMRSEWNAAQNQIYTFVDIAVTRVVSGTWPEPTLQLRVLGGEVGDIGMAIVGAPSFAAGEEVILFLLPSLQSYFPTVGMDQGKFSIRADDKTGERMVAETGQTVDEFIASIESRISALAENGGG